MLDGEIWAWPTLIWNHNEALNSDMGFFFKNATCRWRQWSPGEGVDFDPGTSPEDRALVEAWLIRVNGDA